MVSFESLVTPKALEVIDKMIAHVLSKVPGVTADGIDLRLVRPDDFDHFINSAGSVTPAEADYDQDYEAGDNTWQIDKVDKMYAIAFLGWENPDLDENLKYIQIWVGDKKVREYPGSLIFLQENGLFLAFDPMFTTEKKKLRIIANLTADPGADARDFPICLAVFPKQ